MIVTEENPFHQSKETWITAFDCKYAHVETLSEFFSCIARSTSYFEKFDNASFESAPNNIWVINLFSDEKLDEENFKTALNFICNEVGMEVPPYTMSKLENKDWVRELQKNFKPINAGEFFVYSSYYKDELPNKLNIQLDAGRAFGTGEHDTTSGCLEMLSRISCNKEDKTLDVGTGTAILAIGLSKKFGVNVWASDIDEQAVEVAKENVEINKLEDKITCFVADGYNAPEISENGPFKVICANILAKPLISLAPDLAKNLSKGGFVILSGLLITQEDEVIKAHEAQGLHLVDKIHKSHWSILLLKPNN